MRFLWMFRVPELPEVETVVRSLRPVLLGRRILNAEFGKSRVLIGSAAKTIDALVGAPRQVH